MTTLKLLAATLAAEASFWALETMFPQMHFALAVLLATGLHLLSHWLITQHMTWAAAIETVGTVLIVDLVTHALHMNGPLPRVALHLAIMMSAHLLYHWSQWR